MKQQTTGVYLGSPIDDPTERHFLERLRGDLDRRGLPAMILANFMAGKTFRQIDFLIVRPDRTVHCELKGYSLPVIGTVNGPWHQIRADGSHQQVGDAKNP